jgi:hypothetical protein
MLSALPILRIDPALPMLKTDPALPMLRMLTTLPMLAILNKLFMLGSGARLRPGGLTPYIRRPLCAQYLFSHRNGERINTGSYSTS